MLNDKLVDFLRHFSRHDVCGKAGHPGPGNSAISRELYDLCVMGLNGISLGFKAKIYESPGTSIQGTDFEQI